MSAGRLIPRGNRVVVEPLAREHERFYLPPEQTSFTREDRPVVTTTRGRIIALGPQVKIARIGDEIRCSDTCGHLFRLGGRELRVIREDDIAAVTDSRET